MIIRKYEYETGQYICAGVIPYKCVMSWQNTCKDSPNLMITRHSDVSMFTRLVKWHSLVFACIKVIPKYLIVSNISYVGKT